MHCRRVLPVSWCWLMRFVHLWKSGCPVVKNDCKYHPTHTFSCIVLITRDERLPLRRCPVHTDSAVQAACRPLIEHRLQGAVCPPLPCEAISAALSKYRSYLLQWFACQTVDLDHVFEQSVGQCAPNRGGVWPIQALEMIVGKIPFLVAVNGSTVMLPCTYASCIGIKNLYFNWQFNDNGTMQKVCESVIASEGVVPHVSIYRERVEFVGKNDHNNISILLWNITFEDGGYYTCFGRNPKEKGRNHSATFHLIVVDELRVVDNTLATIIASAVGGAIAALMGFMLLKNFTLYVLAKMEEKNKECLVSSSGIDNTENGLSGSKADSKATPKKK
ncbi:Sodium channel subunit beta-4 [Collichthys lucidus]|uniref:Sodium channel subunit beta-4 n=1 Tax=Collichthys lucidus TaxID=240159 RepID=A0A4U5V6F8_COLLU|nr:Sodium channel subunit beta-4 [Collichthys lucidus]